MSGSPQVTDASAFKQKSLGIQVVLFIVTLGLYSIYWLFDTARQLGSGTNQSTIPILAIIPLVNIIVIWQISKASEAVTNQSGIIVFILFIFFAPVSWYWVQSGMNAAAQ